MLQEMKGRGSGAGRNEKKGDSCGQEYEADDDDDDKEGWGGGMVWCGVVMMMMVVVVLLMLVVVMVMMMVGWWWWWWWWVGEAKRGRIRNKAWRKTIFFLVVSKL